MSVVRKKAAPAVLLGQRVVSGRVLALADTAPYNQSSSMRPDQRGNPLSDLDLISNKQVFGLFVGLSETAEGNGARSFDKQENLH